MSAAQISMVQSKVYDLLADLRPDAVALVDAFDFPDEVLDSVLGRSDGNVYDAIMENARSSRLNQNEVKKMYAFVTIQVGLMLFPLLW